MSPITGGPAGEWPTQSRVLDADPDTPTADAPADTDLAESIKQDVQDALFALNAERQDQGWPEGMIPGVIEVSRLVSAAVLPLVRAQVEAAEKRVERNYKRLLREQVDAYEELKAEVEAARRDALNEAAAAWDRSDAETWTTPGDWLRGRAARGETRQP